MWIQIHIQSLDWLAIWTTTAGNENQSRRISQIMFWNCKHTNVNHFGPNVFHWCHWPQLWRWPEVSSHASSLHLSLSLSSDFQQRRIASLLLPRHASPLTPSEKGGMAFFKEDLPSDLFGMEPKIKLHGLSGFSIQETVKISFILFAQCSQLLISQDGCVYFW